MDEGSSNMGENQPTEPQGLFTPPEKLIEVDEAALVPQQPQSMPTRSNSTTPSGTGDIKLPGEKKSRKGLIAVVIVLILAIAAGGFGIWWVLNRTSQSGATALKTAFNSYANFFLYNSESDTNLEGLYQYGDTYYIGELNSEEQIDAHFAKSEERYQNFLDVYKKYVEQHPDNSIDANVAEYIESYYGDLDLLRFMKKAPNITANDLLGAYLKTPDGLSAQIDIYYDTFAKSSVESTRTYGSEYKDQLQYLLTAYQTYNAQGCLADGTISASCRQNTENEQLNQANGIMADFSAFYSDMAKIYQRISVSVYENIWVINLEIK